MTACKPIRVGDEMQCACGLTWSANEPKPPCRPSVTVTREQVAKNRNRRRHQYEIGKLRARHFR